MENSNIEKNQEKFIELFNEYIKREGAENLLDWLINSDFFTAPASLTDAKGTLSNIVSS